MSTPLTALPRVSDCIDRYRVLLEVAHGGMAAVYAVSRQDMDIAKILAMKVLLPHLAADQRFVDMLFDEARIAAQVQHPNVVSIFEMGEHEGHAFIVMEYLRGCSFSQLLRHGDLPMVAIVHVIAEVAEGLHAAHEASDVSGRPLHIVHRDVSPQNVHVGYDGQVKVVDFGIAAAAGRVTTTKTGEVKGKLSFLAPEQLHHRTEIDRRTDVWALGVMTWQSLSRRSLFRGETDADTMFNVLNREAPDIQAHVPECPDPLADCIMACLDRDPARRPHGAGEVAVALRRAVDELGGYSREALAAFVSGAFGDARADEDTQLASALQFVVPRSPRSRSRRWLAPVSVLVLGGLVAAGAAVLAMRTEAPSPIPELASPAEPTTQTIRVAIASDVRLVLVDGQLHEERPLELQLVEEETVQVVLVGPNGEEEHRVGIEDDGSQLALVNAAPTMAAPRAPERRSRSRMRRSMHAVPAEAPAEASMREDSMRVDGRETGLLDVEL